MARFHNIVLIVPNLNDRRSDYIVIVGPDSAFRCGVFEVFIRYLRTDQDLITTRMSGLTGIRMTYAAKEAAAARMKTDLKLAA